MRADHLSYRRATNVSIIGIILHALVSGGLAVYGAINGDAAAITASLFVLLGVLVWTSLAILFDQHRRERLEAVEQENFAAQELTGSSVFEEAGDELLVAAKRLEILYRFMLPAVSIAVGSALIAMGVFRFPEQATGLAVELAGTAEGAAQEGFTGSRGIAIAIGIGLAVIGFVFARYTSGMARAKVWEGLRGGSVYAVGASLMGLLLAVTHFLDRAGIMGPLAYLDTVLAVAMIVLGAEVFLNFVLDIYRPRKPGDYPRPAFDSRLLGFVAAPDRIAESISEAINYQFGFEVTSSWFYRLLSKSFLWLILIGGVASWLMTSFAVVEPHQRGVLLVNGRVAETELEPGLHIKPPWPFGRVVVPEFVRAETQGEGALARSVETVERTATGVRMIDLAAQPADGDGPTLWEDEALTEYFLLVQPGVSGTGSGFNTELSTGLALATVRVPLYYSIAPGGAEAFLRLGPDAKTRDEILKAAAQRELVLELGARSIDQVIGSGRDAIRRSLQGRIESAFADLNPGPGGEPVGAGVQVLFVGFEDARPPREAAASFGQIFEAQQKFELREALALEHRARVLAEMIGSVENAEAISEKLAEYDRLNTENADPELIQALDVELRGMIERSGGTAADTILAAQGDRWENHMTARASALEYSGRLDAYRAAPEIVEARLRLQAMAEAIEDLRVYIVDEATKKRFRFDLNDVFLGTSDGFEPQTEGL